MIHTTFALAKKSRACIESYRKMGEALGGVTKYGKDTPIPLDKVLMALGLKDAIWALRCTIEPAENLIIEFACQCAEHVLHFYTEKYPGDKRPQVAIDAARVCLTDKSSAAGAAAGTAAGAATKAVAWAAGAATEAAAWAAKAAAGAAAGAATEAAAWAAKAAAGAAAEAAETKWQTETLLTLLKDY